MPQGTPPTSPDAKRKELVDSVSSSQSMEFPVLITYAEDPYTNKAVESFQKYFNVSDNEYLLAWANCSMWKNIFLKGE